MANTYRPRASSYDEEDRYSSQQGRNAFIPRIAALAQSQATFDPSSRSTEKDSVLLLAGHFSGLFKGPSFLSSVEGWNLAMTAAEIKIFASLDAS